MWDRLEHDLVERVVEDDRTPCLSLGLTVLVGPVDEYPVGLRLARDAEGRDRVLTEREGRAEERAARQRLEQRNAELERELAARDGAVADGPAPAVLPRER